ncbi:distal tail protein Dit [Marinilactibacillus sp. Marseille-P9653]|uniref:distal tail protein Dit n=1 Tax=Marinilactibacillus sp. Marseille-P9653 TaxID=2866583 RepID=UPI001CE3D084|nr:distal tail protein Dit [Marinilactibacillus sp. Marseille-P9653]
MANIKYNGKNSEELGLIMVNEVEHELASNDIEVLEIEGRDGVLLFDKQRLKPIEKAYPMHLRKDVYQSTAPISEWLNVKGWHELLLSWDPDYQYKATVINSISIEEVIKQFGKIRVAFLVHPIKFLKTSLVERTLTKGQIINNRGNVRADPIITLTGNGDTVITINGRRTVLEDVQGSIVLDMQNSMVYSGNLSAWNKLVRESNSHKPYLDVGNNTINWTGTFTAKIKMFEGVKL